MTNLTVMKCVFVFCFSLQRSIPASWPLVCRKRGLRLAKEGAKAAVTFVKFLLEQQPHAVGPRQEVVFHKLLSWAQQWWGAIEGNDGMSVSREACTAVADTLPGASAPFAFQLVADIYGEEGIAAQQVRPSLAATALEEAIYQMSSPSPCPEWRTSLLSNNGAQTKNRASNDTLIDLCGKLRYLHQEVCPLLSCSCLLSILDFALL